MYTCKVQVYIVFKLTLRYSELLTRRGCINGHWHFWNDGFRERWIFRLILGKLKFQLRPCIARSLMIYLPSAQSLSSSHNHLKLPLHYQENSYSYFKIILCPSIKLINSQSFFHTYSCSYHRIYYLCSNLFVYMPVFFWLSYLMDCTLISPLPQVPSLF